jgi:hypothetical protein
MHLSYGSHRYLYPRETAILISWVGRLVQPKRIWNFLCFSEAIKVPFDDLPYITWMLDNFARSNVRQMI